MSILKYIKNPFKGLFVSKKKEEEGMTQMYNQTGDNDIVRIILSIAFEQRRTSIDSS
jgi:hypothetical protein